MLPTYKQAEQFRKAALEKDEQIKALQAELSGTNGLRSNGVGVEGDASYWKHKYDVLMASMDG
jgi:hypothetical protein